MKKLLLTLKFSLIFLLFIAIEGLVAFFLRAIGFDTTYSDFFYTLFQGNFSNLVESEYINFALILIIINLVFAYFFNKFLKQDRTEWKQLVSKRLKKAQRLYASNDIDKVKQSIIEADKILDYATQKAGINGKTYYQRIGNLESMLTKSEFIAIKAARKTRNQLVHEMDYHISMKKIKKHFWQFRKVILKLVK